MLVLLFILFFFTTMDLVVFDVRIAPHICRPMRSFFVEGKKLCRNRPLHYNMMANNLAKHTCGEQAR